MKDNTKNWSNGLKFVQFMKNRSFHSGIKQTPYRAMFGTEPRVGLTSSLLPLGILGKIDHEDDLQIAINQINT